jgi:hypothetical protein
MASLVLTSTLAPGMASGAQVDLVQWLSDAAAPALQAAAPTNDPALVARETLNRGLGGAFSQLRLISPRWLQGIRADISFVPMLQPSYAVSATQPLLRSIDRNTVIDLYGGVIHDTSGRTAGDLGLRYSGRFNDQPVMAGLGGAVENRWLQAVERYTINAELRLGLLEIRASMFDEVPENPATRQIAKRRLDGYDLQVDARLPYLSWAWLKVHRFWQIAADGESGITRDRISLRLIPLVPLEIETGTQAQAELRSWFAQLRWRIKLGG